MDVIICADGVYEYKCIHVHMNICIYVYIYHVGRGGAFLSWRLGERYRTRGAKESADGAGLAPLQGPGASAMDRLPAPQGGGVMKRQI